MITVTLSLAELNRVCRKVWDSSVEGWNGEYCHDIDEKINNSIESIVIEELIKIEKEHRDE